MLESDLLALKQSTLSVPLLEHVFTVPHLPRHVFVLASPTTIGQVIRRFSLPLPRVIPRQEWGNSLDTVPWTRRRGYPLGSFVKIMEPGPYRGDLAYVMAIDFKEGESTAHEGAMHHIIYTPQSLIVAAVPRLPFKNAKGKSAPPELELQFELIRGQIAMRGKLFGFGMLFAGRGSGPKMRHCIKPC